VSAPLLEVQNLVKRYPTVTAVDGLSLSVPEGVCFGLLGPNGAGKTTAVNILTTLLRPDTGELTVAGHSVTAAPDAVRAAIGVTGQFSAVDPLLTGGD
jgi:ABC-2 type transport system ATP-binding protein